MVLSVFFAYSMRLKHARESDTCAQSYFETTSTYIGGSEEERRWRNVDVVGTMQPEGRR